MIAEYLAKTPDTRLLPGEHPDIRMDIRDILGDVGEAWLYEKNIMLGNLSPSQLIGTDKEFHLRLLLRQFATAELS
jgi:hypothetical protein